MNIPITSRVKRAPKKGCDCKCGKTPAKFNAGLKAAAAGGKLDDNPKFKALVEKAPAPPTAVPKMWGPAKRKYGAEAVAKNYKKGYYGK